MSEHITIEVKIPSYEIYKAVEHVLREQLGIKEIPADQIFVRLTVDDIEKIRSYVHDVVLNKIKKDLSIYISTSSKLTSLAIKVENYLNQLVEDEQLVKQFVIDGLKIVTLYYITHEVFITRRKSTFIEKVTKYTIEDEFIKQNIVPKVKQYVSDNINFIKSQVLNRLIDTVWRTEKDNLISKVKPAIVQEVENKVDEIKKKVTNNVIKDVENTLVDQVRKEFTRPKVVEPIVNEITGVLKDKILNHKEVLAQKVFPEIEGYVVGYLREKYVSPHSRTSIVKEVAENVLEDVKKKLIENRDKYVNEVIHYAETKVKEYLKDKVSDTKVLNQVVKDLTSVITEKVIELLQKEIDNFVNEVYDIAKEQVIEFAKEKVTKRTFINEQVSKIISKVNEKFSQEEDQVFKEVYSKYKETVIEYAFKILDETLLTAKKRKEISDKLLDFLIKFVEEDPEFKELLKKYLKEKLTS